MGIHLVFFLHVTTGPDNTNNVMALAFGGSAAIGAGTYPDAIEPAIDVTGSARPAGRVAAAET